MNILELHLKNFGRFSDVEFQFSEGLNVICGPNEAGKTTIYHSIGALLFGMEKQRGRAAGKDTYTTYQPWENKTWYEGALKFETGGKIFCLERNFYQAEKSAHLFCETDGEELSLKDGDLEVLLGEISAEIYYNTAAVGQMKMKPKDIIYSYLKNYIAGVQESGYGTTDVVKAIAVLESRKKTLEKERTQQTVQIYHQIEVVDAGLEVLEKEIFDCEEKLRVLKERTCELTKIKEQENRKGILTKILEWMKKLFCRKRIQEKELQRKEQLLRMEEKQQLLQELLCERESRKEELLQEKDSFYEKLHEISRNEEIKALELAVERIQILLESQKEEVLEHLISKTSDILKRMTSGKYEKLILKDGEEPVVWDGKRMIRLFQLSCGCVDLVYLALRIGLQDLFFEEDTLPLIFDDAFVYFDEERLKEILCYLSKLQRQVFLLSCHKREVQILEEYRIPYKKILL